MATELAQLALSAQNGAFVWTSTETFTNHPDAAADTAAVACGHIESVVFTLDNDSDQVFTVKVYGAPTSTGPWSQIGGDVSVAATTGLDRVFINGDANLFLKLNLDPAAASTGDFTAYFSGRGKR